MLYSSQGLRDVATRMQSILMTHRLGTAEAGYRYASIVIEFEVQAVERGTDPEIETGEPHQYCVLETLGEVWMWCVPCDVPVLKMQS